MFVLKVEKGVLLLSSIKQQPSYRRGCILSYTHHQHQLARSAINLPHESNFAFSLTHQRKYSGLSSSRMRWTLPSHRITWCLVAWTSWSLQSCQITAARTVDVLDLPVLTSLYEPSPIQSKLEHLGSDANATIYIRVPPSSMDQELFITFNVCSLSLSRRYPRILLTNATSYSDEIESGSSDILYSWDQGETKAHPPEYDSSGFTDTTRANEVVEVLKGQYAWSIQLEGNAGFANWTGWMGDGGLVAVFAEGGDAVDIELGIRLGSESSWSTRLSILL